MGNKNFLEIKEIIYKIIRNNGSVSNEHLNFLFKNRMLRNYCEDQLKQDENLRFFKYASGKYLYCFKNDAIFYYPIHK
jgi:hypothetical protein